MVAEVTASRKYLFWAIEIILVVLSFLILKDYLVPLVSAYVLAFLAKPVYSKLVPKLGKSVSALLCIIGVILIIIVPLGFAVVALVEQTSSSLAPGTLDSLLTKASEWSIIGQIGLDIVVIKQKAITLFLGMLTNFISSIPHFVLALLVISFGMFYSLIHWDELSKNLTSYLPFPNKNAMRDKLSSATKGIVYGYLLVALLEFFVAAIGFYISGAGFALLLAAMVSLLVFIPGLGPAAVWVPTMIYYFLTGDNGTGIGVLITGLIISVIIDQFIAPKIVGKQAKIHPFIMLLGVLGGIPFFGVFGFIIGPIILVYAIRLLGEAADQKIY